MEEIWKDIKEFEGVYQISNYGRLKSLKRYGRKQDKIIKPVLGKRGYFCYCLWNKQKAKNITIHRLVAQYFIPNQEGKREVNHKDLDKTNNAISNLEWVTPKENSTHACANLGTKKHSKKRGAYARTYKGKTSWISEMNYKNKRIYLGFYDTKEEAQKAYYDKYVELYSFAPWI